MVLLLSDPFASTRVLRKLSSDALQITVPLSLEAMEVADFIPLGIELPFTLRSAVKKRQIEYLCGRYCAMTAMKELGLPSIPLAMGEDRAPIWPEGLLGSITHTQGWASAAVGRRPAVKGLGLDLEHEMALASPPMVKHICLDERELSAVAEHLGVREGLALTLIFSAKESFFKATYNRVQRYYGFHVARVQAAEQGQIHIQLLTDLSDELLEGAVWPISYRFLADSLVETLILEACSDL